MQSLAHYALLGSLLAGAAGVLVLVIVTLKHGVRRQMPGGDDESGASHRTFRAVRLADTVAVVCFAIAAGLGVIGLMHQTRVMATGPRAEEAQLLARLLELEHRLASAEAQLRVRDFTTAAPSNAAPPPWEERIARIERRLGSVEDHAVTVDRIARERDDAAATPKRTATVVPSASPREPSSRPGVTVRRPRSETTSRSAPPGNGRSSGLSSPAALPRASAPSETASTTPSVAPAPPPVAAPPSQPVAAPSPAPVTSPPTMTVAAPGPSREAAPARPPAPTRHPTLGERISSDWDALKRDVRRSGEEWADGWRRLRRLFTD